MKFSSLWALVLLVVSLSAIGTWAAKPGGGGGGPVPPGTIYYTYGGAQMKMLADGSAKQLAPAEYGKASAGTYGTPPSRWYLSTGDFQLWATTDGVDTMQITNMVETDNGDGSKTMMRLVGPASWSNEGVDSFVSVAAIHWVQPHSEPVPPTIYWDFYRCVIRLNVSALELQARKDGNLGDPMLALTDAEFVVTTPFGYTENLAEHHWSADGTKLAYIFRDESQGYSQLDVFVADVGPTATLPVDALDAVKVFDATHPEVSSPRWAPPAAADPDQVAIHAGGILYKVRGDGTGLTALVNTGSGLSNPAWSPDGQHLAFRQVGIKGFTTWYQICRIPAAGGSLTVLTSDQDKNIRKYLTAWR